MPDPEKSQVTDEGSDRRYFVIVPQVIWAHRRDVYDLALWLVVKIVTGEDGECYLSRDQRVR